MTEEPRTVSRPDPDPTLLTTAALLREIDQLKNLTRGWVDALQLLLESQLSNVNRLFEAKLSLLTERFSVVGQQFESIKVQFSERDTRTEQTAAGVKIAVDAALQAAKEAVAEQNRSFALATGKSETAMTKQMDALALAIQTANKGLDDKIGDLKDRLTRIEGMDLGSARNRGDFRSDVALQQGSSHNMIALAAAALAALAIMIELIRSLPSVTVPATPPMLQRQSVPLPLQLPKFSLRVAGFD